MYLEYVKNKPGRGANFIVRPRAQNCLATPLHKWVAPNQRINILMTKEILFLAYRVSYLNIKQSTS